MSFITPARKEERRNAKQAKFSSAEALADASIRMGYASVAVDELESEEVLVHENDDYKVIYTYENGKFCYELIEKAFNSTVGYWELNELDNRSLEEMIEEEEEI